MITKSRVKNKTIDSHTAHVKSHFENVHSDWLKMVANEEALHLIFSNILSLFLLTVFRKLQRKSKLKVIMLFRISLKLSYDKATYFCNVFDARTLLPPSYLRFTNLLLKMFAVF